MFFIPQAIEDTFKYLYIQDISPPNKQKHALRLKSRPQFFPHNIW